MANCYRCKAGVIFDDEHIGRNGKKIPLDPDTHAPHDCPMREPSVVSNPMQEKKFVPGHVDMVDVEDKDDHGNENTEPLKFKDHSEHYTAFVDHTTATKGLSKVMIFSNETKADTQAEYNNFLAVNKDKIRTQGAHDHVTKQDETEPLVYTIYLYYEETKQ